MERLARVVGDRRRVVLSGTGFGPIVWAMSFLMAVSSSSPSTLGPRRGGDLPASVTIWP